MNLFLLSYSASRRFVKKSIFPKSNKIALSIKTSLIYCAIVTSVFSSINTASAQDNQSFAELSQQTISRLNGNCQGSTQLKYQSQILTSPDSLKSVYINMILRRVGQYRSRNTNEFLIKCNSNIAEKIAEELVIENADGSVQRKLTAALGLSERLQNYYVVANPVSFSPDNRYLIVRLDVFDGLNKSWVNHIILDTLNNYSVLAFSNCNGFESNSYLGFISSSEVVFACENTSEPGPIEVVDLTKRSRQKISTNTNSKELLKILDQVRSYGLVSAEFVIVNEQQFPPR